MLTNQTVDSRKVCGGLEVVFQQPTNAWKQIPANPNDWLPRDSCVSASRGTLGPQ